MNPTTKNTNGVDHDVLVVGAGTAGMETAISLGDMGYHVLLVERAPSVGGKTILLSKVFPSLDCASCIATPKMAASSHHPNVKLMVYSEVDKVERCEDGTFDVVMHQKPTFVDPEKCTGCALCEEVCTVAIPDEYNYGLVARRAAHIAFPQAVPKKSVIDRRGTAPCSFTCPAGVNPGGWISLVRAGKHQEAFELHLQEAPLVGSLSRACYAPCEGACSRSELEGPVNIRAIKRFMADRYYGEHPEPAYGVPEKVGDKKVAIAGSGPAGLTAAFHLARLGHQVTVFEENEHAGGMLRHGMPAYRMPNSVLDRDIKNVTALGVEIKTGAPVKSMADLKKQGYDATFVAVGGQVPRIVPIKGEDLLNVGDCMAFLKNTKLASEMPDLNGKNVVVIGGGNVAVDVARSAVRLGTESVSMVCLEARDKMLAHDFEIVEAEEEGITIFPAASVTKVHAVDKGKTSLEFMKVTSLDFSGGTMHLETEAGSEQSIPADIVILAIGLQPSTAPFENEMKLKPNKIFEVNEETLETSLPGVFAGGDAATGPSIIVEAMGQGKRAAFYIDRYLNGEPMDNVLFDNRLPMVDKQAVIEKSAGVSVRPPAALALVSPKKRIQSFEAFEGVLTEDEARQAANRCLDCSGCCQCKECQKVCPAGAIDFTMRAEELKLKVGSVVLANGFQILDPKTKPLLGYGKYPNVISAPQMDRLLAPTRPYNAVLRPSDGREPENIAMVLCTGSRDHTLCNPLCCRIGCMYAAKQAQLLMGALPMADVTVYYIDIRAFGKGYDEFFEQSRSMDVQYVKGKVARIDEGEANNLIVHYEDIAGGNGHQTAEHDLVVLAVGLTPNTDAFSMFAQGELASDAQSYVREMDEVGEPGLTSIPGVYAAGTLSGARDIPDTVLHSGAATTQAACYLKRLEANNVSLAKGV